jgi:hypothetical protein
MFGLVLRHKIGDYPPFVANLVGNHLYAIIQGAFSRWIFGTDYICILSMVGFRNMWRVRLERVRGIDSL